MRRLWEWLSTLLLALLGLGILLFFLWLTATTMRIPP